MAPTTVGDLSDQEATTVCEDLQSTGTVECENPETGELAAVDGSDEFENCPNALDFLREKYQCVTLDEFFRCVERSICGHPTCDFDCPDTDDVDSGTANLDEQAQQDACMALSPSECDTDSGCVGLSVTRVDLDRTCAFSGEVIACYLAGFPACEKINNSTGLITARDPAGFCHVTKVGCLPEGWHLEDSGDCAAMLDAWPLEACP